MSKINLLRETLDALKHFGKLEGDVEVVLARQGAQVCSWQQFKCLADKEYDNEIELRPSVRRSLVIQFKNGDYLKRHTAGIEGWVCVCPRPELITDLFNHSKE